MITFVAVASLHARFHRARARVRVQPERVHHYPGLQEGQ